MFMPGKSISRPEAMAVLIRMFEGKTSPESRNPRRGDYYLKGWALGITSLSNQTAFDAQISRREIAIYIYRLQKIVSNPSLKLAALQKIANIADLTGASSEVDTGILGGFTNLADSISVSNDPELQEAINWMNDHGMTSYKTIAEYKPFEILNREQASKILTTFGTSFGFVSGSMVGTAVCSFKDIGSADASLVAYIQKACEMNILK
jgi:O-acetylhomoserine/O-acetylserine sulfhydrylase-like pyridoxal-dependent enzyme